MVPVGVFVTTMLILVAPYRLARLTTFVNPDTDPLGASYQIKQVLLSLGSGGITGVGIGKSKQKYEYLPEANTDSIFAIIGEETGFIGALTIMAAFLFIIWRGFVIGRRAPDVQGRLIAFGVSIWIAIQVIINLGAMVALLPLTGVPLPLISYGGSSLIIILSALGIVLNVSRQSKK
jgi:cell division protein FtsW